MGASLSVLPSFYQGLFFAPIVVAGALKTAIFAANLYEKLGFRVEPLIGYLLTGHIKAGIPDSLIIKRKHHFQDMEMAQFFQVPGQAAKIGNGGLNLHFPPGERDAVVFPAGAALLFCAERQPPLADSSFWREWM